MTIFKSVLTTFISRVIFRGGWGSSKNWLELKIKQLRAALVIRGFAIRSFGYSWIHFCILKFDIRRFFLNYPCIVFSYKLVQIKNFWAITVLPCYLRFWYSGTFPERKPPLITRTSCICKFSLPKSVKHTVWQFLQLNFRTYSADDYEDFPEVPPLLRLSFNIPEEEYFKTPGKRYRKLYYLI